jgi:hypothetical protein
VTGAELLADVLAGHFTAGVATDFDDLTRFLRPPRFPGREEALRLALAEAIVHHRLTRKDFEALTAIDWDTQADVDRFLLEELWEPLFPGQSVQAVVASSRVT